MGIVAVQGYLQRSVCDGRHAEHADCSTLVGLFPFSAMWAFQIPSSFRNTYPVVQKQKSSLENFFLGKNDSREVDVTCLSLG